MSSSFRRNVSTAEAKRGAATRPVAPAAAAEGAFSGGGAARETTAEAAAAAPAADARRTAAEHAARQAAALAPGERLSAHNGQPLVSTGVPSLDDLLGGGLPVGAVMLILEDRHTAYSRLLLGYFLAQGLSLGHALCVASADDPPDLVLHGVPWLAAADDDPSTAPPTAEPPEEEPGECEQEGDGENEKMTIAWRYQRLRQLGESDGRPKSTGHVEHYCDEFDLTRRVPQETLAGAALHLVNATSWAEEEEKDPCARLLLDIARVIAKEARRSNVLRIAVQGLCSPAWPPAGKQGMFKFLHGLRGLLRRSPPTACVLTMPAYTFEDDPIGESILRQALHCVDASLRLRSFAGHPEIAHPSYASSYHGLVDVLKHPRMNGIAPSSGPGRSYASYGAREDLAFRLRRRRFLFETFHLPPEGGVGARSTPANAAVGPVRKPPPAGVLKKSSSFASDSSGAAASPGEAEETTGQGRVGFSPNPTRKKVVAFAGGAAGCGSAGGGDPLLDF